MRVLVVDLAERPGAAHHAAVHRDLTPGTAFLQKPFTPDVFARKVRNILDY
jgi:hypothetical protein